MVMLQLKQIRIPPGQRVLPEDISWQEFEAILNEYSITENSVSLTRIFDLVYLLKI
jgi:hypothetical protein